MTQSMDKFFPVQAWHAFTSAKNTEEFCQAWLALVCGQIKGCSSAVLLLAANEAHTYTPIAGWPKVSSELSRLGKIAERVLTEKRGVVERVDASEKNTHIGYPIQTDQRLLGAIALEVVITHDSEISAILRHLHWSIIWIRDIFHRSDFKESEALAARVTAVMEAIAIALSSTKLQPMLFDMSNHIARKLRCSRVVFGVAYGAKLRVAAISDIAWFEKNTSTLKAYTAAIEEAFDQRTCVQYRIEKNGIDVPVLTAHAALSNETGASAILSLPLLVGVQCHGILMLEHHNGEVFTEENRAWLEACVALLSPILEQKKKAERGYAQQLSEDIHIFFQKLLGPRYLLWKGIALLIAVLAGLLFGVEIEYRIAAKTVIEGEVQRVISAPFEAVIFDCTKRAGDHVKESELLCQLDDRDLKIEHGKWRSEQEQYDKKLREAMGNRDLVAIQVVSAQLKQAEAQVKLVQEKLHRARILAPFDGVIISGDLSQQQGSPVEQGKKLFEIAPLNRYRVILQVDEREIRHVKLAQSGQLLISGITEESMPFTVSQLTSMATAQEGRNYFRVEAQLHGVTKQLRPGMEGIGKINAGQHSIAWILVHSFMDWLRLTFWTWIP